MTRDSSLLRPHPARLLLAAGVGVCLFVLTIGCEGAAGGPERAVVSGSVTYDGEPVEGGIIRFVPTKGTEAPVSGAQIKNGQYAADGKGGVPVGTHKVEILGYEAKVDPNAEPLPEFMIEEGAWSGKQYIPEKYNKQTELEITIESGSGKITKDFQLDK